MSNDAYNRFLRKAAPESGGIKNLVNTMGLSFNHWEAKPWPLDDKLHPTTWAMERSKDVASFRWPPRRPGAQRNCRIGRAPKETRLRCTDPFTFIKVH